MSTNEPPEVDQLLDKHNTITEQHQQRKEAREREFNAILRVQQKLPLPDAENDFYAKRLARRSANGNTPGVLKTPRVKPWEDDPREPTGERGDLCPCGHQCGKALEVHIEQDHQPEDFGLIT